MLPHPLPVLISLLETCFIGRINTTASYIAVAAYVFQERPSDRDLARSYTLAARFAYYSRRGRVGLHCALQERMDLWQSR